MTLWYHLVGIALVLQTLEVRIGFNPIKAGGGLKVPAPFLFALYYYLE